MYGIHFLYSYSDTGGVSISQIVGGFAAINEGNASIWRLGRPDATSNGNYKKVIAVGQSSTVEHCTTHFLSSYELIRYSPIPLQEHHPLPQSIEEKSINSLKHPKLRAYSLGSYLQWVKWVWHGIKRHGGLPCLLHD